MERVDQRDVTAEQLAEHLVMVRADESVVGFVESAGPVFVALHGPSYDRAVEVAQSLSFDAAVAALLAHARVVAALSGELAAPSRETPPAPPSSAPPSRVA